MERIRELDGLRAIAILMVIAWHYIGIPSGPESWAWRVFYLGHFGVDLFFVLSGFLIGTILLDNRDSERYFASFYGRRALRIWPVYYLMVFIYLLGRITHVSPALFDGVVPGWTYLFGIQNVWMARLQDYGASWLGGTWSLAIEEQFYLVFPLIVRFVPQAQLERLLVVTICVCPLARAIAGLSGDHFGYYVLPQFRADVLSTGALIACWRARGAMPDLTAVWRFFRIGLIAFPLLLMISGSADIQAALWQHTFAEFFFGAALLLVLERKGSAQLRVLRSGAARFFAQTSYAAYLTHHVVAFIVFAVLHVERSMATWSGLAATALSFGLTFALCGLSYRLLERPLIALGHARFGYGSAPPRRKTDLSPGSEGADAPTGAESVAEEIRLAK